MVLALLSLLVIVLIISAFITENYYCLDDEILEDYIMRGGNK